ncbi:hypothetical protein B0T13DRAFT_82547 [Neurospora crassa]|nr:hypothetical protein B0T13DRAFT_82547 [Neurospora crassa]
MSRTSQTLTNTDLAFLLCTISTTSPHSQSQSQFPKVTLSFETNYGLVLSLEPDDGSITISLRTPLTSTPMSTDLSLNPFDSATPIQSQQQLFTTAPVSHGHGSIDGVLFSSPLRGAFGMMMTTGTGGASITPARSTPSTSTSRLGPMSATMTQALKQQSPQQDILTAANKAGISNSSNMKIRYYIRPSGLEVNSPSSSHMYYTAAASASCSTGQPGADSHTNPKLRPRTLHRVKLSHLQSLYHTNLPSSPSSTGSTSRNSTSISWFDAYLDWIDRLDDAIALSRQRSRPQAPHTPQPPQTPRTATSPPSHVHPTTQSGAHVQRHKMTTSEAQGHTSGTMMNHGGLFTDSGERSLWLVEGMLLASWLSLQEGVEGVEYLPLPHMSAESERESGIEGYVYRLETNLQGMEKGGNVNNAGVMMKSLLKEVVRAGNME